MLPSPRDTRPATRAAGGGWLGWALKRLALAALLAYVASYAYLYQRGVAEADAVGSPYFFYVPVQRIADGDLTHHYQLLALFEPINRPHRSWFGGREPCRGITFGLSR